jgi:eukaryotic-like serine/threonine-protein kinase
VSVKERDGDHLACAEVDDGGTAPERRSIRRRAHVPANTTFGRLTPTTSRRPVGQDHPLSPAERLGHYEILAWIGGGGMGDVYRARDSRLSRDVALKVLHRSLQADPRQVEQFAREARLAGTLNHPNIVTVFDVGTHDGVPFVVCELLEGESLRVRLRAGGLPHHKALDYAIRIADALGAAHERGIIHRDVKPENTFVTRDGRIKLLDFGVAKLRDAPAPAGSEDPTPIMERPAAQGTPGYMSPEEVAGDSVDQRTDLFSLGAVLYEMFTGVRAFHAASRYETMTAVLRTEPTDVLVLQPALSRATALVVRRCLEKSREERFQSARDLAFHLRRIQEGDEPRPRTKSELVWRRAFLALCAAGALAALALLVKATLWPPAPPRFERMTFSRARIGSARFAADGQAVFYSEAREDNQLRVERLDPENPESAPISYPARTEVLAVRPGQIALSLGRHFAMGERFVGMLAVATGSSDPRALRRDVEEADWEPGGTQLAAACSADLGVESWLEYPLGEKIYRPTRGSVGSPRISPDGRSIAFLEDPAGLGLGGRVMVIDLQDRKARPLTEEWKSARGVAWSSDGQEVWFTAGEWRDNRALRAVTLRGRQRVIYNPPASLTLWDIARDGRVLFTRDDERKAIVGVPPGETAVRDLSWQDRSGIADLSRDGRWLLFGDRGGIFLRRTDGSSLIHLGFAGGFADTISPDGKRVVATNNARNRLLILRAGIGEEAGNQEEVPNNGIDTYEGVSWFPDGRHLLVNGKEPGRDLRAYVQDLQDGSLRPLTPEGARGLAVSQDGKEVAGTAPGGMSIWRVDDGSSRGVRGSEPGDRPVVWSEDGQRLWLFRRSEVPANVYQVELATGKRSLWKTLIPPDSTGIYTLSEFHVTPTGHSYFYSYIRVLSQLYVARGLK